MKICKETVQRAVDEGLAHVQMTEAQKQAILAQCRPSLAVRRPRPALWKRLTAAAAAAVVLTVSGMGVVASNPGLAGRLGMLGSHVLTQLHPVGQVAEDNGIRMEVLAAMNDEDVAAVYLTLQDTTGQGRVTQDVELRHFDISGAQFTSAQVIGYDEASGTATLCLTGEGGELSGRKVSVTLRSFLTGWDYVSHAAGQAGRFVAGLGLPAPAQDPQPDIRGVLTTPAAQEPAADGSGPVLLPTGVGAPLPGAPWAQITAAGVLDGALHLQLLHDEEMGLYNQVNFYLADRNGRALEQPVTVLELGEPVTIAPGWTVDRRQEHVLPLPEGLELEDVQLMYDLSVYDACQEGVWSVAFALESAGPMLTVPLHTPMQGWSLDAVEVSALGVTLRGSGSPADVNDLPAVTVLLKDGSEAEFFSTSIMQDRGQIVSKQLFRIPLDLEQLGAVLLDGVPLELPAP